ncbi:MAG TPA: hypothetical protein VF017_16070 [Thermoanaerobaculia bacterium]|nr:hypothetical protein [Thermoanaerobaculia bacterium]
MKRIALALALVGLVAGAGQIRAEIGTIDDVPAATLLLPYFEVDLDDPNGVTTLFSINNSSATAILAHVTLWTDLSVPTLDFNVYLTGYDVQSFNLRDLFSSGTVPRTASDGQDPADTISPQGDFSQDINFASCTGQLPLPPLPAVLLDHIRAAHTGQASPVVFGGLCSGVDHGDNVARGYITVDTVNNCSLRFPGDVGYFISGGQGDATNQNVMLGDYFYVNSAENFAQGETMVHIEADAQLGAGNYTFYRKFTAGDDNREGLDNLFFVRFLNGGAFDGGTDLVVWRDSKRGIAPFSCALVAPSPFPLSQNQIVIFDEQENPDIPVSSPFSPPIPGTSLIPFPWEANRVAVGGADFPVPFDFGWLYLNLNSTVVGSQVPFEPEMQNWVTAIMDASGRFSVGFDAFQLSNVTDPAVVDTTIGN